MIAFLKGELVSKTSNAIIIDVSGIGYKVFVGEKFLKELQVGLNYQIHTYHHVKEEASDLYGFESSSDLEIFSLLLGVSGVGPKSALGVLSVSKADDVSQAILQGDPGLLTKVAGIGKKTAERIVLELKTKIGRLPANKDMQIGDDTSMSGSDEIDALITLGYSISEARTALSKVPKEVKDSGERVKEALKKMKK